MTCLSSGGWRSAIAACRTFAAAHIKAHYKVPFADAFAIALAQESAAPVVTGDPEFKEVEKLIPVLWLPR